jgi:nitroreductase/NAD-dependent dihydropyrimidine dehydrogenase PreA subunit
MFIALTFPAFLLTEIFSGTAIESPVHDSMFVRTRDKEVLPMVTIDPQRCNGDGLCARICAKVFEQDETGSIPRVVRADLCHFCGHCVMICPQNAIRHSDFEPSMIQPVQGDLIPSHEQMREMIVSRRSIRTFQNRPVGRDFIEKVIDGARFAPSAKNTQSTHYTVVEDKKILSAIASETANWLTETAGRLKSPLLRWFYLLGQKHSKEEVERWISQFELIAERMGNGIDTVLFDAPTLLLFHADESVRFANENANLALQNATLIACSLGLGSFYTGYVVLAFTHRKTLGRLVDLPRGHKVFGGLALGFPRIQFSRWIDRRPAEVKWM